MSELRDLLAGLGFVDVRSLLQSGNLVLRGDARTGGRLERTLETEAAQRLGLETDCFVRTATEWKAVVSRNPFPTEAERDPAHLVVMFLKEPPKAKDVAALRAPITGPEIVWATGLRGGRPAGPRPKGRSSCFRETRSPTAGAIAPRPSRTSRLGSAAATRCSWPRRRSQRIPIARSSSTTAA